MELFILFVAVALFFVLLNNVSYEHYKLRYLVLLTVLTVIVVGLSYTFVGPSADIDIDSSFSNAKSLNVEPEFSLLNYIKPTAQGVHSFLLIPFILANFLLGIRNLFTRKPAKRHLVFSIVLMSVFFLMYAYLNAIQAVM